MVEDMTLLIVVRPNMQEAQLYSRYPQKTIEGHIKAGGRIIRNVYRHNEVTIEVIRYKYVPTENFRLKLNNTVVNALQSHGFSVRTLERIAY